ncbi:MAG: hypothetical protein WD942_05630 [Dehalococcoidia bacterium]
MNCGGPSLSIEPDQKLAIAATNFLRHQPINIEPRRIWPGGLAEPSGRIPDDLRLQIGRSLSELGDGGWSDLVSHGKYQEGVFADELVDASVRLIQEWAPDPRPTWITFVPSVTRPTLVSGFADRLEERLGWPVRAVIRKVSENRPQKEMENSAQQYLNVADSFRIEGAIDPGPVLLIDDLFDSRWTMTVIGVALREAGSGPVFPFALASAVGT